MRENDNVISEMSTRVDCQTVPRKRKRIRGQEKETSLTFSCFRTYVGLGGDKWKSNQFRNFNIRLERLSSNWVALNNPRKN